MKTFTEDEKMPLSNKEYKELRAVMGMVSALEVATPILKKRAQMVDGTWRKLRQAQSLIGSAMAELMGTIPAKKLLAMQKDLQYTRCEIRVRYDASKKGEDDYVYVSASAVDELVEKVMNYECFVCDKTDKQARKCEIYKLISDVFPWDLPKKAGACPLAGMYIGGDE